MLDGARALGAVIITSRPQRLAAFASREPHGGMIWQYPIGLAFRGYPPTSRAGESADRRYPSKPIEVTSRRRRRRRGDCVRRSSGYRTDLGRVVGLPRGRGGRGREGCPRPSDRETSACAVRGRSALDDEVVGVRGIRSMLAWCHAGVARTERADMVSPVVGDVGGRLAAEQPRQPAGSPGGDVPHRPGGSSRARNDRGTRSE